MIRGLIRSHFRLIGGLIAIGILFQGQVVAQDDPNEKYCIYDYGNNLVNIRWANDSLSLVYQEDYGVNGVSSGGNNSWNQYSVVTHQTVESDTWPLQPSLTPTQQQTFEFYTSTNPFNQTTFAFYSPNLRYVIYIAQNPQYAIGIADLQTGQHQILDEADELLSAGLYVFDDALKIVWSPDSNAFAILTQLPPLATYVHLVSNISNWDNLVIRNLTESGPIVDGRPFYPLQLLDISTNGSRVLLHDGYAPNSGRFIVWKGEDTTVTQIPFQGAIADAMFVNSNGQRVMFVDEGGLKQFYEPTARVTILNPSITSTWAAGGAYFSPDGRYLAIYNGGAHSPDALYLFDIGGTNPALFRTDTREASLLQPLNSQPH